MSSPALPAPLLRRAPAPAAAEPRQRSRPGRRARRAASAFKRRDPAALEQVWIEYGQTVFGFLVSTLRDRARAEDVHQQVFVEVWQRAPEYDSTRAGMLTWILTIARSRAIDELRRRVPEPRDPDGMAQGPDPDPERSPDAVVERWSMAHLLSRLRPEEADLLRLRFYEELSQSEIAERTGIPLGTVKMRMVAALERLREMIDSEAAA